MPTPAELGYHMPAEWERHAGTWLTWPRSASLSFRDKHETVALVYAGLIRHLVQVEEVNISVWDAEMEAGGRDLLTKHEVPLDRVHFHHFPAYEPCCRDHGPIFLARTLHGKREQAIVDWDYNAWGNKFMPHDLDNAIPRQVAQLRQLPLFAPGIVLEGGAIEVNGRGALLTTEACLLNSNRNPHLSQREIAQYLRDFLGVTQIIWLGEGIVGDETDGHIDELARFVNPTTIVTVVEENPDDANYQLLRDNLRRIRTARDQYDRYFRVVELPMPGFVEDQGQRLPASYANFYIANGIVLVPTYQHANDAGALRILQKEFPDRRVIGLDARDWIRGFGSWHGLTQQEPE